MSDKPTIVTDFEIDKGSIKNEFDNLEKQAQKAGSGFGKGLGQSGITELLNGAVGLNQTLELASKVKEAFSTVVEELKHIAIEAENMKQLNYQFDVLSERAIGVGNDLKDAFKKAALGLTDDETLLRTANMAMVTLSEQAQRLPELFEIARKASLINGESAAENFSKITTAIETGSARALKSVKLYTDLEKAVKKYADSIGVLPDKLTEAELHQVRMDAIIEKASKNFEGVKSVKEVTPAYTRLGVEIKRASETIYSALTDLVGPALASLANNSAGHLQRFTRDMTAAFGHDETEKRTAQIEKITDRIETLQKIIAKPTMNDIFDLPDYKKELAGLEARLQSIRNIQAAMTDDARKASRSTGEIPEAVRNKMNELRLRENPLERYTTEELNRKKVEYNLALTKAQDEELQIRQAAAQRILDEKQRNLALDDIDAERQIQLEIDLQEKKAALEEQYSVKKGFSKKMLDDLIAQETINSNAKIEAIETEGARRRLEKAKAIAEQLKGVTVGGLSSTFQEVGRRLQAGEGLFDDFGKGLVGILGDLAIKLGEALIAQGIALEAFIDAINTLLPGSGAAAAAAGVGLVIFGAALKASVGLGGGGGGTGVATAGAGIAESPSPATSFPQDVGGPAAPKTSVTLNVNGNIIPRDRNFALELTDLVREAFESQAVQVTT